MSTVLAARTVCCAAALVVLIAAGPLASPAAAATLSTGFQNAADEGYEGVPYALLTTAPGSRAEVSVRRIAAGWRFSDASAPLAIAPDARCSPFDDTTGPAALCAVDKVVLRGAEGDDVLRADADGGHYDDARVDLSGGGGDDAITAGPEDDRVTVTAGHDTIDAGAGQDELVVGYPGTSTVDLVAGTATAATGSATLRGIEVVTGLRSTIVGDDGPNTLITNVRADGGGGDDVLEGDGTLRGGNGNDRITGAESLFGDAGNDTIVVEPVRRVFADAPDPRISCGPGTDVVAVATGDLRIASDCERLATGNAVVRPTPIRTAGGRAVIVSLRCAPCRGTLRLRTGRGLGASVRYAVKAGRRALRLPVPRGIRIRAGALVAVTMRAHAAERGPVVWRTTVR